MPLNTTDFVPQGPIRSADIKQFVDLFTGVMLDQPITFRNAVTIGGNQGASTAALSLYAATGQTGNLINLYPSPTSLNPTFGFAASGAFGWGPGGTLVQDTFLSRIGTQNGHTTDTPGLLLQPNIEVTGSIFCDGPIDFPSGSAIADGGTGIVNIGTNLAVQTNLYVGYDHNQYLYELSPTVLGVHQWLSVGGANPWATGLGYGEGSISTRSADMPDVAGAMTTPASFTTFAGNWLQFDPHFYKVTAGVAWPGVALLLDYDVDGSNAAGGRISMIDGKVGIGGIASASGDIVQLMSNTTVNGNLAATGNLTTHGNLQADHNLNVDTLTFDSATSSSGAKLAFPATIAPKISLYDAGGGAFFGLGINSNEMYMATPSGTNIVMRINTGAGAVIATFNGTNGQVVVGQPSGTNQIVLDPATPQITFVTPVDPQGQGGPSYRNIKPSSRPASSVGGGEIQMDIRLYVDGDITSGTNMHAVSFMTTSDPNLKNNPVLMADTTCMTRVRGNVPVYTYQITPPSTPGFPAPTPNNIGFMAPDVYSVAPEFCALDSNNQPVAVVYGQIAALLWGALRNLDARCQAHGI